tara:strand:+ start:92 stop:535 length:444 start_codon:yes stop_codon:yes gene_type:complete
MLDNKKAQIGDTMTWVVATLVIIVVLGILVFATYGVSNSKEIRLFDKEKDFIATISITNFLSDENNVKTLENFESESSQLKIKKFLDLIPAGTRYKGDWALKIEKGGNSEIMKPYLAFGALPDFFEVEFEKGDFKLNFWAECPTTCK